MFLLQLFLEATIQILHPQLNILQVIKYDEK